MSRSTPRLVTTGRPVRRGTNGGVTLLGLGASLAGGTFIGTIFYIAGFLSPGIRTAPQVNEECTSTCPSKKVYISVGMWS